MQEAMKFPHHSTKVGFLMDGISIKECDEPRFEGVNQSQVLLGGAHPCPERMRMQQDLEGETGRKPEGCGSALRLDAYLGLLDFLILERLRAWPSDIHTCKE